MYIMMFAAAIKLKYSRPKVKRAYSIPGGKTGMWIVAGIGVIAAIAAIAVGFIPPVQFGTTGDAAVTFVTILSAGILIVCVMPFIIRHFRKPSWVPKKSIE
jgi:hypothetical protein